MIGRPTIDALQIEELRDRAAEVGDGETVEDCEKALRGSRAHKLWCERLIRGKRSDDHDRECTCDDCRWLDDYRHDRIAP